MRTNKTYLLAFFIAFILGLAGIIATPFFAVVLSIVYFLSALAGVGFLLSSYYLGKKSIVVGLLAIFPVCIYYGAATFVRGYKRHKAETIISQLHTYHSRTGRYPFELDSATTQRMMGLRYESSNNQQSFRIEYLVDKFNRVYFDNSRNEWGTLGWSD